MSAPQRPGVEGVIPSGTVTFVFTDVEGSAQRWERDPEAMQAALRRHDVLVRSALEAEGGYVPRQLSTRCAPPSSGRPP